MANIIGYNIYVDGVKYNDNPLRSFRHLVTGLTNGQQYEFTVRAVDEFGNETGDSVAVVETPDGSVTDISNTALSYTFNLGYAPGGIRFSSDGSKLFVLENSTPGRIHRYDLTFPFFLEDDPIITQSFTFSDTPGDLVFSPNGNKLLTSGSTIREYQLSSWDLSSLQINNEITEFGSTGIEVSPFGHYLYCIATRVIRQYAMYSPWSLAGYKQIGSKSLLSVYHRGRGLCITSNGSRLYATDGISSGFTGVYEISLPSPYSIEESHVSFTTPAIINQHNARGIAFSSQNNKMFISRVNPDQINEYTI